MARQILVLDTPSTSDELRGIIHLLLLDQFEEEVDIRVDDDGALAITFPEATLPTTFTVSVRTRQPEPVV